MSKYKMSGFPKHQTGVQKKGSPVKLISGQGPQTSGEAQTTTISTASGAMQGAQAGAMFGPWGMAAGAIVGGAVGFAQAGKANEAARENATKAMAAAKGQRSDEMAMSIKETQRKAREAKEVGVVNMGGAPPPPTSTPVASKPADLGSLYGPKKTGNITKFNMSSKSGIGHMTKSGININV